ncbi:MAG: 3-phosphoshikimate 1-carboxyvinyltransferase, partial [Chloroflexia bacterium]
LRVEGRTVTLFPPERLPPFSLRVPGDLSSAAFLILAGALVPDSEVVVEDVGLNPTRTGLLDVLRAMGAELTVTCQETAGPEPVGTVTVRGSCLKGTEVAGDLVVRMIDEFPVLAVAATQARGRTVVRDAGELRVKETDRIATLVSELRRLGAKIEPLPDGFVVEGPCSLRGGTVDSHGDHRLAMALAVAGLVAQEPVAVEGAEHIEDSFPGFAECLKEIGASDVEWFHRAGRADRMADSS